MPASDEPPPDAPRFLLRPLTRRRVQGSKAGELYTRSPKTEAAIRDALGGGAGELPDRLRSVGYGSDDGAHRRHPRFVPPEALAYLARYHYAEADRLERESPSEARDHARAAGAAANAALAEAADVVTWRFDNLSPAAREWAESRLTELMVGLLFDGTAAADVLQVAFGRVVKRRVIRLAEQAARRSDPEVPDGLNPTDPAMTPEQRAAYHDAEEAVAALPERLREPWELNRLHGIPVQSTDPDVTPLTERLGLAHTTIYNRIREAEQALRDALQSP